MEEITPVEGEPKTPYLSQFMPTERPVHCALEVDFERWARDGVNTLFTDVEDTLGITGEEKLKPELVSHLAEARSKGIKNLVIVTNKRIGSDADRELIRSWEEQLDATLTLTPLSGAERKPSPLMIYKGLSALGIRASQAGVLGDKATAEIRSGYFAGVEHRAWVRPFGENRHLGDRMVRDPFEAFLRIRAHLKLTPIIAEEIGMRADEITQIVEEQRVEKVMEALQAREFPDGTDRIVGHGIADIMVPEELLRSIKQPAYRKALEEISAIYKYYSEEPTQKLKEYLHEHGRNVADGLTYSRVAASLAIVGLSASNLSPENKRRLEAAVTFLAHITDVLDGPAAGAHKDGRTVKGAADDQNIDKMLSAVVDIFALMPAELISKNLVLLTIGREVGITALRRPFKARGIDTKSVRSGKNATLAKGITQTASLALGKRFPRANNYLQAAAFAMKIGSALQAPAAWIEQHELKVHENRTKASV